MSGLLVFYLSCFAFGLVATLVEFLVGKLLAGKLSWRTWPTWFSLSALLIMLTWFGGTGFVFHSIGLNELVSFIAAFLCGVAGYIGFVLLLNQAQTSQNVATTYFEQELTGTVAKVSNPIFENSSGEIYLIKNGQKRVIPAKSLQGSLLGLGTQVVIIRMEHGVAYVEEVKHLLSKAGKEKWYSERF